MFSFESEMELMRLRAESHEEKYKKIDEERTKKGTSKKLWKEASEKK